MADSSVKLEQAVLADVPYDDEEVALVSAATEPAIDDEDPAEEVDLVLSTGSGYKSEAQVNGVMVLSLLDKIIGVVDQIQQTQYGLEARQESMEKSVSGIQGELTKMSKSHTSTAATVNKMLEKVRKVSANVKSVRSNMEKQSGQIKKLESNENELLKRRDFKVLIYQDHMKAPKASTSKAAETVVEAAAAEGLEQIPEDEGENLQAGLNSDEEVEIEEIIEESRAQRIKRTSKQRVDNIKKAFSKEEMEKTKLKTKENFEKTKQRTRENMEKTRQRTRENMEKTRQRTRENLEKTKHSLGKKMGKLSSRMTPNQERKVKVNSSKEKVKKSMTPDHMVYARAKTTVYRVPPFTFYVKKVRDGEDEEEDEGVQNTEIVEVTKNEIGLPGGEGVLDVHLEVEEGELVNVDGPEMEALLEMAKDSPLVLVETDHLKKAHSE